MNDFNYAQDTEQSVLPEQPVELNHQVELPVVDAQEVTYAQAVRPSEPVVAIRKKEVKEKQGTPGLAAFGFASALLSLFLCAFYKEAFTNYIFYRGAEQVVSDYFYYATIGFGGASALLALIGIIFSPIGGHIAKRRQGCGRGLAVAGVLIAIVAILLIAAVSASHFLLFKELGLN